MKYYSRLLILSLYKGWFTPPDELHMHLRDQYILNAFFSFIDLGTFRMAPLQDFEHRSWCSQRTCLRLYTLANSLTTCPGRLISSLMGMVQCTPTLWTTSQLRNAPQKNNHAQKCPTLDSGRSQTSISWTKIIQLVIPWWTGVILTAMKRSGMRS